MLLVALLGVLVLAVPLAGGRLEALAGLRFRHLWMLPLALGLQVIVISLVPGPPDALHQTLHVVSYVLAAGFLFLNRRIPGLWLVGAGAALNFLAIVANGGVMPATQSALAAAGLPLDPAHFHNTMALHAPHLAFLGDVFAVPSSWPLHNVFSPGDVVLVLGIALAVHRTTGSRLVPSGKGEFAPLLRRPAFMRLWTAQAVSNLGDWTYALGVGAIVAERTRSAQALAILLIVQVAPAVLCGMFLGPLVDRRSRTGLMVGADLVRAAAVASLIVAGTPSIGHIYAVAACLGVFGALFQPSLQASIPNVVEEGELTAANAMVGATYYASVMVGPALGGVMVAALGATPVFALNAASFLVSAALVAHVRLPRPRPEGVVRSVRRDLVEGARYALTAPLVRGLLIVIGIVIVAAGTKAPLESLFVLRTLSLGPQALGLVAGSWGLGMVLGSLAAPTLARRWRREHLFWIGIAAVGAAVMAVSRATELPPVLLAWLIAGAGNAIGDVSYETLLQERTPDGMRGRVFAAAGVVTNGGFLTGAFLAGWLGTAVGVRAAYAVAGGLLLLAALTARILVARAVPALVPETAAVPAASTATTTA